MPLPAYRAPRAKGVRKNDDEWPAASFYPSFRFPWLDRSIDHPTAGHLATTKRYDSAERNDTFRSAERCLRLKIFALRGETLGWNDWKRSEDWSGDYGCCRPCRQTRLLRCMKSISQAASPSRVC